MPKNVDEIVVGANGSVYAAPDATPLPDDIDDALNAAFVDLGFTSEDGVKAKDAKSITDIGVWQRFYPVRKIVDSREFTANFVLRQFSGPQVELAFGGATVTSTTNGFKVTPPSAEVIDIRSVIITWQDGTKSYMLVIPRCIVTDDVELAIVRNAAADLPIGLAVLASEDEEPWYFLTDDETFAEAT